MWAVQLIQYFFNVHLTFLGVYPRTFVGLPGILTSPFIHAGFNHLIGNSLPFLITAYAIRSAYPLIANKVFLMIYLLTGIWVWVAARPAFHIGASGLVYGMIAFLLAMGLLRKEKKSIALAFLVVFLYGSFIWGLFPIDPAVSWESHMLGAVAGTFAAFRYWKVAWTKKTIQDPSPAELEKMPYWKYEVEGPLKPEFRMPPHVPHPPLQIHYNYKKSNKTPANDGKSSTSS